MNDIGLVSYIKERESRLTAGDPSLYQQQRCVLFEIIKAGSVADWHEFEYVIGIVHHDEPMSDFVMGQSIDAKVVSGFRTLSEADQAFETYGPSYLVGDRLTWSEFLRVP